jgi:RNA polymerase sigma factor (sigma-70 family)
MNAKSTLRESVTRAACNEGADQIAAGVSKKLLVRLGRRLGGDAEDYVQEGHARFYQRKASAVLDAPALIARIALNFAVDVNRRRERERQYIQDVEAMGQAAEHGEQFHDVLLKQVIVSMPEKQRHVFLLNRFSGLSYPEIAARLGISVKSQYSPAAVSPAGAAGLMQLMPATAADLGVQDRFDPAQNIMGGADYLARQLLRFRDVKLALSAYNSGPTRVAALGRVPSIPETQQYVEQVIGCYLALTAGRRVVASRECRPLEAAP